MTVMDYRTRDGLADYGFSVEFRPAIGWRVYIVFQAQTSGNDRLSPSCLSIESELHVSHTTIPSGQGTCRPVHAGYAYPN